MINTIFYFPNEGEINFEGYYDRVGKNQDDGISNRTIVFEPDSGEIWKNGQRYSYSKTEIDSWIQSYLTNHNIKSVDLTDYALKSWVETYISGFGYVKSSDIKDVFKGVSYNNNQLIFTKWDNTTTSGITIGGGNVNLNQPLSGINSANLGTPSNGQGLVYDNDRWQYRSYGSVGATYTPGPGIKIEGSEISLKPASANGIGGIITNGTFSSAEKKYPVEINSSGQAYVQVPWESN